jgi:two-component system response regulator MtrA
LVVDDDPALAEMLGIVLRSEGFLPSFVADGERALAAFRESRPDIVLLDLMLPGMSGIDVARAIRTESGIPIVMLTAKSDTVDVVLGLESGADDYVVKPFKPKELVARMRARLRRGEDAAPEMLTIGPPGNQITIDVPAHTVVRDGDEVKLTPLEFDCWWRWLASRGRSSPGKCFSSRWWGYRHAADTRLVNVHVQRLRAKIEPDPERRRSS